jgi:hypothetical protein
MLLRSNTFEIRMCARPECRVDSQRWAIAFKYNKFATPMVDGGQVHVPNYNGGVDVYGP